MRSYVIVDVFTDVPLEGNPVAVFTDGEGLEAELMQRTARELNLSETVFLVPGDGRGHTPGPGSSHRRSSSRSPGTRCWAPRSWSAQRAGRSTRAPADRRRGGHGRAARGGRRIAYGEMAQPLPTWEPFGRRRGAAARRCGVSAPSCRSRSTTTAPVTRSSRSRRRRGGRAATRTSAPSPSWGRSGSAALRLATATCKTRMFAPGLGVGRGSGHRLGGRSAGRSPGPPWLDAVRSANRDPPGRRDRPSVAVARRWPRGRLSGSSACWSVAAR